MPKATTRRRAARPAASRAVSAERWFPVVVLVAAIGVYANTLWNGFVWDDILLAIDNPSIKSWAGLPGLLTQPLVPGSQYYRPLQALTFMVDYAVSGLRPAIFHATNIALHAGTSVLLYRLAVGILRDPTAALVAALLFGLHPIHSEAVAYVAGRSDSLSALCLLGAFLLRSRPVLSAGAFLAALLARESALVFVLLSILVDATGTHPEGAGEAASSRRRLVHRWTAYAVVVALYVALRTLALRDTPPPVVSTGDLALHVRLLTMAKVVVAYLGLLALPVDLHMERIVPPATSVRDPAVVASAVLLALLAALVVWVRKTAWPVAFGFAWFLVALLPVSNAVPLDAFMAEHWLYVPSMGLCMAGGWVVARALRGRFRGPVAALLVAGLFGYGARTVLRNAEWRNELSLFEATVRDSPSSFRARSNLGRAYLEAGDTRRAASLHSQALSLAQTSSQLATAHANLGITYWSEGRHEAAIPEFRRALEINGPDAAIYTNLAAAFLAMDRPSDAEKALQQAIATDPRYAPAWVNLGVALEALGRLERAGQAYTRAIEMDPDSVQAYTGLGDVHLAEGRPELAERAFRAALRLQPGLAVVRERLERALAAQARGTP